MKILMVTSEVTPFAKTGGLADAVSALSAALQAAGHDVRIVMPRYYKMDRARLRLARKGLSVGLEHVSADVYETTLPAAPVPVYCIDYEPCFGRDGIYGTPGEPDYRDNPYRFALLCRAAFDLCLSMDWRPDIVHAHDWEACMALVLLKHYMRSGSDFFRGTAGILTIHNMGYQGHYPSDSFPMLGIDWELFYGASFERNGGLNLLQAGIAAADMITTVSPTYAREIQTPEGGFGLDGLMRVRSDRMAGIINGVDTDVWNPATDRHIPANYSVSDMKNKAVCKRALQEYMGLPVKADVPLVGIVTRLAQQKGIAEVFAPMYGCMYRMCTELNVQFAVLGSGEPWCEGEIRALQRKLPNLRAFIGYDEQLSHMIEAGADFFLMPSIYEPCGLNQMYSQLYGTLPLVRATGGLYDTVTDYNPADGGGTGFLFFPVSPDAVFDCVRRACGVYEKDRPAVAKMQKRAMSLNYTWGLSAAKYADVYKTALGHVR